MIDELKATMTTEDVEQVSNLLEEIKATNQSLPDNNEDDNIETGESRLTNITIDPATGDAILSNTEEVKLDDPDFTDLLKDSDIDLNFDQSPLTLEEMKAAFEACKDDPDLKAAFADGDYTAEDINELLDLAQRYQNKEEISSLYNKLPKSFQSIINSTMGNVFESNVSNQAKSLKNTFAEMLLDQLISSIMMERANRSINTGIEKIFIKATGEVGDTIVGYTQERNESYRKYIEENITDEDKKREALDILDCIDNAYKLTDLKEFCKKCKIRKIDVENPDSTNKDIDFILDKYNNNPNFNIYNIYNAQKVLERNLNPDEVIYTPQHCRAFLIAFSKYCMNFSPTNAKEHIFMFYTIYNILLTDVNKGEKAEVSNEFLANVKECIHNLIQRNSFLSAIAG